MRRSLLLLISILLVGPSARGDRKRIHRVDEVERLTDGHLNFAVPHAVVEDVVDEEARAGRLLSDREIVERAAASARRHGFTTVQPNCFTLHTAILTPDDVREIGALAKGDRIFSFDETSGRLVVNEIERVVDTRAGLGGHETAPYAMLRVPGVRGGIGVAVDHPFMVGPDFERMPVALAMKAGRALVHVRWQNGALCEVDLMDGISFGTGGVGPLRTLELAHPPHNFVAGGFVVFEKNVFEDEI